ncbi:histone-like nucleoid-structuring protein, MvaT/MvaU family [Hahella sp. HN01]|uniref:histone-like nucleoid-structuring protein, MvaT/MvaU family n=1 Tax=Hahella sp. HN01 TaxID=2847262 RepID=UPI001C1EAE8B|nr:histone-like nucleoid-structuring protein, MvaT/MvaU family [Hahella sp. HN01]MBU6952517.1 H-NS histone family protein [Hahella sp. HN01]
MKKINAYENTLAEIEALKKKLEALENDDELKKSLEFKKQLEALMKSYNVSSDELLNLLGGDKAPAKASASDKRRGARPLKVYKNPQTGEVVETRGGNHKVLNAWKEQYGKETVESWLAA